MSGSYTLERQAATLGTLSRANSEIVKAFADELLETLEARGIAVNVLENRTGLAMLPAVDNAQGTTFHLGEVLVAEARVRVGSASETLGEGYAAVLGRDLEHALGAAILDAALSANLESERIGAFVKEQARALEAEDDALLRRVEATRVEMETF